MARTRSEEARKKMIETTKRLVITAGVAGVTIEEVSRRSGVAKTTIYRHFGSKNELLIASLDGTMPVPAIPDTGNFRRDLVEFLGNVLPIFASSEVRALFLEIFAATARDPELGRIHESMMDGRSIALITIFERAKARGEIPADLDYATAFDHIEGPFIVRSLFRPEALADLDLEATVDRIVAALNA